MAEIIWDVKASNSFKKQIDYMRQDSLQTAGKVIDDIFAILDNLPSNPRRFPADKFKTQNDGNFRAFEKNNIRIAYLISRKNIRILRVRHVKQ